MDPHERNSEQQSKAAERGDENAGPEQPGGPAIASQDWDAIASGEIVAESVPENGDLRYEEDEADRPIAEDDDNPYQNSDEALPDDEEEAAIGHELAQQGTRSE